MKVKFFPPIVEDDRPKEVLAKWSNEWETIIVGHFIGYNRGQTAVNSIARRLWTKAGLVNVLSSDKGFYFFKFIYDDGVEKVLKGGPWHMANCPIVLRKWQPNLCLSKEDFSTVPLWVKIYGIPLEFQFADGLSYMASRVGKE